MFDFGNDDKEKLRENMEEIKDMVNDGERMDGNSSRGAEGQDIGQKDISDRDIGDFPGEDSSSEPGQEEWDSPQVSPGPGEQPDISRQEPDQTQQSSPDVREFQDSGGQAPEGQEEEDLERELDEFEQKFSQQEQTGARQFGQDQAGTGEQVDETGGQAVDGAAPNTPPPTQHRSKSTREGMTDSRDTRQLSSEVPSPPETRELNVPDIDRGPLFLKQRKFVRAKQMVEDMLYLSDEMEKTVNDLEAGLQEDKEIERDIVEILREAEDNRTEVEDIISPREE